MKLFVTVSMLCGLLAAQTPTGEPKPAPLPASQEGKQDPAKQDPAKKDVPKQEPKPATDKPKADGAGKMFAVQLLYWQLGIVVQRLK